MDSSRPLRAIRVVLADPRSDVREGLRAALGTEPDVEVVDEAPDAAGLLAAAALALPDVVLVDLGLLRAFGGGLIPAILARAPGAGSSCSPRSSGLDRAALKNARTLIFEGRVPRGPGRDRAGGGGTGHRGNDLRGEGAGRAGARAVPGRRCGRGSGAAARTDATSTETARSDLRVEITVSTFETPVTGRKSGPGIGLRDDDRRGSYLTPREVEILRLIARGRSNREIGAALSISEGTVKGHLQRIFHKMVVDDRTQAAMAALKRGAIRL
jgi:DNA-binding NarL/FixJ family response regulator